MQDIKTIMHLY